MKPEINTLTATHFKKILLSVSFEVKSIVFEIQFLCSESLFNFTPCRIDIKEIPVHFHFS